MDITPNIQNIFVDPTYKSLLNQLNKTGWDTVIEDDKDWGVILIAGKREEGFGYVIRRIKPFELRSWKDMNQALALQKRFRGDLVEILPYALIFGKTVYAPTLTGDMTFLSSADFEQFDKINNTSKFSLKNGLPGEASKSIGNPMLSTPNSLGTPDEEEKEPDFIEVPGFPVRISLEYLKKKGSVGLILSNKFYA